MRRWKYVSFGSSGTLGCAYVGMLDALESHIDFHSWRQDLKGVSGTSAGCIAALALLLGLTAADRKAALIDMVDMRQVLNGIDVSLLFRNYGVDDGTGFRKCISNILQRNGLSPHSTLGDLHRLLRVEFVALCTDLRTSTPVALRASTHPHVKVCDAIYASCCIPFLFTPMELDGMELVDGCMTCSVPTVFEAAETLHVWMLKTHTPSSDHSWFSFLGGLIKCTSYLQEPALNKLRADFPQNVCVLDTPFLRRQSTLDLDLKEDVVDRMVLAGYTSTLDWIVEGKWSRVLQQCVEVVVQLTNVTEPSADEVAPNFETQESAPASGAGCGGAPGTA